MLQAILLRGIIDDFIKEQTHRFCKLFICIIYYYMLIVRVQCKEYYAIQISNCLTKKKSNTQSIFYIQVKSEIEFKYKLYDSTNVTKKIVK